MFIGLDRAKRFGLGQLLSAICGILDKAPYCEICWKSFISPVSLLSEQDCGCYNSLNGSKLQRNDLMRARESEKTPEFELELSWSWDEITVLWDVKFAGVVQWSVYWKSQYIELWKEGGSGKPKDFPRRMEIKCSKYKNYYRSFCLKTIPISRDFGAYAKAFLCQPFLEEKHHVYEIDLPDFLCFGFISGG